MLALLSALLLHSHRHMLHQRQPLLHSAVQQALCLLPLLLCSAAARHAAAAHSVVAAFPQQPPLLLPPPHVSAATEQSMQVRDVRGQDESTSSPSKRHYKLACSCSTSGCSSHTGSLLLSSFSIKYSEFLLI
jgi:hypothetical protein